MIGGYVLGPTAGEILFGDKFTLGARDLALLAAGSGLFILALTLAQALIAVMGHARATWAWVAGNVAFWVIAVFARPRALPPGGARLRRRLRASPRSRWRCS